MMLNTIIKIILLISLSLLYCKLNQAQPVEFEFTPNPTSGKLIAAITINGYPASVNDWVAAFDEDGNCAGAVQLFHYNGQTFLSLQVYGNDPTTPEDDGVDIGESFTLKMWITTLDSVFDYTENGQIVEINGWTANLNGSTIPGYNFTNNKVFNFSIPGTNNCYIDDWTALKALYEITDGDSWINRTGWDTQIANQTEPPTNCDLDSLFGVSLDGLGRIRSLNLTSNNLSGSIPSELGQLCNLNELLLNNNQLSGNIPAEIGSLTNLSYLNLSENNLTGTIPIEICNLPLEILSLHSNNLTGSYPNCFTGLCAFLDNSKISENNNFDLSFEDYCLPCHIDDWTALKALYESTNGDNWHRNSGWEQVKVDTKPNCNLETLHGVQLNTNGRVNNLILNDNLLNGNIPPEIGSLSNLGELNLSYNNISGNLPIELGDLHNLRKLYLSGNELNGNIPPEIGSLSNLGELNLSHNNISGNLPIELGDLHNLRKLYLSGNELNGNILPELGNLISLFRLSLNNNQLTGNIPIEIYNLSRLSGLELNNNQLTGNIPSELAALRNLRELKLSNNQLTGAIPPELGTLDKLWELGLSNNKLSGCYPTNLNIWCNKFDNGNISNGNNFKVSWKYFCEKNTCVTPCHIDDWTALKALYENTDGDNWWKNSGWKQEVGNVIEGNCNLENLYGVELNSSGRVSSLDFNYNKLNGIIPSELGKLNYLTNLNLSNNKLEGNIPSELGSLNNLEGLSFYNNKLTGSIPAEFVNLTKLESLNFSRNELNGNIPVELCSLSNLKRLYLDFNQLNGNIPSELSNLSNLEVLSFGNNKLTGSIPSEIGNLSNLKNLYLNNNQLNGNIPIQIFNLKNLEYLYLNHNQLDGNIPPQMGNLNKLRYLLLNNNKLSGKIPSQLDSLTLYQFRIYTNLLSGCYPENLNTWCDSFNNKDISDGNNFDASWNDFCSTYAGVCNPECRLKDWTTLKVLYQNTNGDNWNNRTGWDELIANRNRQPENCSLNELYGVSTNTEGRVEYLNLENNMLTGSIPEELDKLDGLKYLHLANNQLSENIPTELGNLVELEELKLNNNHLTGSIPKELGYLSKLVDLQLHSNQLTGCYPYSLTSWCNKFQNPNISNNNNFDALWENFCENSEGICYEGTCNIDDWSALKALYENTDGDNWINRNGWDTIVANHNSPPQNCNLAQLFGVTLNAAGRVKAVNLNSNQLNGSLPSEIGLLNDLEYLYLTDNQLDGNIPFELNNTPLLSVLALAENNLNACYPIGLMRLCAQPTNNNLSISEGNNFEADWEDFCATDAGVCRPYCNLDDWYALKKLYEYTNGHNWTKSKGWEQVTSNRASLDCDLSNLYGITLNADGRVENVYLSRNELTGSIPSEVGNLTNLTNLNLNSNKLNGNIPFEFGKLNNLLYLELFKNQLEGDIPKELGDLNKLKYLLLGDNQLSGQIPSELGNLTNLEDLILYSNQLSGSIPPELGNSINLHLQDNKLSGKIPKELASYRFGGALYIDGNYFSCEDLSEIYELNKDHFLPWYFDGNFFYNSQYFKPQNYEEIKSTVFDSLHLNNNFILQIDIPFDTIGLQYQWFHNGDTLSGATQPTLNFDTILPHNSGKYTLTIKNRQCFPTGPWPDFISISEPIYIIIKGYDLFGQPVQLDQIMVEFSNKEETGFFEDEILLPNAGFVQKACNCSRELYLWQFPSTEAATKALLEIDQKTQTTKITNKPKGGFNNLISIGDTSNTSIAYNIISDQFSVDYPDSVKVFILDSGIDTTNYDASSHLFQNAPIDSCYTIEKSGGYNYTDSAELVNENYVDDLWHGTFGFRSIADSLSDNSKLKIVPLKIFNKEGKGNLFDMTCALYQAIDHNADIINISAGYKGQPSTVLEKAILLAREKGIFITAAAGNDTLNIDSIPQYPAYYAGQYYVFEEIDSLGEIILDSIKYDNVISVASINVENELSRFSNYGQQSVTLGCYGENIHSYALQGLDAVASGSSMATYFATRALALEIAENSSRSYRQIWADFESDWLINNPDLVNLTQTGKQINFDIEEAVILGCTNPKADNYFQFATEDDGSCIITSIDSSTNDPGFTIFPNPSNGNVYLNFHKGNLKEIEVFNSSGQIVTAKNSLEQTVHLNMQDFPKGIYFVKVVNEEKNTIKKFVLK